MDKALATEGGVLAIRKWQGGSMYEIDLCLPDVQMEKWITIPRIKCKTGAVEYRDYTPAGWKEEERSCTVYIDAAHQGSGSSWVKNLRPGDSFICAAAHAAGLPDRPGKIAGFGDGSTIGHFLALKQLTDRSQFPMEVKILLQENLVLPEGFAALHPEFEFIVEQDSKAQDKYLQLIENKSFEGYGSIYVAGYIPMVQGLRKLLKKQADTTAKVFAHGFWS